MASPVRLLHTQHSLKKAKQRPDRKGQPGGKFADPVTFFPKARENIDATGSVTEGYYV